MKFLILSLWLLLPLTITSATACPNIRFVVVGREECKKCAMLISETPPVNGYRIRLRLVNDSANPVVIYGFKYDNEFWPTGYLLSQSQDTCQWKYPNGEDRYLKLSEVSPELKSQRLLSAGDSIEIEATFNRYEVGERYKRTVFVSSGNDEEPCEIVSEEFVVSEKKAQGSAAEPLVPCRPNCTLSLAQAPALHGLKLGMSVGDVLAIYPDLKINPPDKFNIRWADLYVRSHSSSQAILPDVVSMDLHFLGDRLAQIEISYWASGQSKTEFQAEKIAMLGLTNAWHVGNENFECENFEIRAVDAPLPKIVMTDKAAKKILAQRIEDSYTTPKNKK